MIQQGNVMKVGYLRLCMLNWAPPLRFIPITIFSRLLKIITESICLTSALAKVDIPRSLPERLFQTFISQVNHAGYWSADHEFYWPTGSNTSAVSSSHRGDMCTSMSLSSGSGGLRFGVTRAWSQRAVQEKAVSLDEIFIISVWCSYNSRLHIIRKIKSISQLIINDSKKVQSCLFAKWKVDFFLIYKDSKMYTRQEIMYAFTWIMFLLQSQQCYSSLGNSVSSSKLRDVTWHQLAADGQGIDMGEQKATWQSSDIGLFESEKHRSRCLSFCVKPSKQM